MKCRKKELSSTENVNSVNEDRKRERDKKCLEWIKTNSGEYTVTEILGILGGISSASDFGMRMKELK